jgi:hypothetical protein
MTFTWPSDSPPPTGSANSRRRRDASARPSHWTLLRRFQRIANWGACRKTPSAAQNHVLEAKEGGFCKVRDLLSTYGFRSGVEPMVGYAAQTVTGRRAGGAVCIVSAPAD